MHLLIFIYLFISKVKVVSLRIIQLSFVKYQSCNTREDTGLCAAYVNAQLFNVSRV